MHEQDFIAAIEAFAAARGIDLPPSAANLCSIHVRLMLEWNQRLNLTRITDPHEVLVKHLLDSLAPAQWLPTSGNALDVGSGAGFPGVPLKILRPDLQMVLLEGHRKKVSFLRVLLSQLALPNVWAVQGRWENFLTLDHPAASKRYALITLRAVRLEPEHLDVLAPPLLEPDGTLAWWAGPSVDAELEALGSSDSNRTMVLEERHSYALPGSTRPRQLLVWRKREQAQRAGGTEEEEMRE